MIAAIAPANIHFTEHALARMAERGITKEQVLEVLVHPMVVVQADEERFEARGLRE